MIQPNTAEPIVFRAVDSSGSAVTGLSITLKIFNPTNGQIWDWSNSSFSASPSSPTTTLTEIDASTLPGYYYRSWPGAAAGYYIAECTPPAGQTEDDHPPPTELRVSAYARTGDAMALVADAVNAAAVAATAVTEIQSGLATAAAVAALPTAASIADAVLDEALSGHATAGTLGATVALVDVAVSSRATNSGVWATAETGAVGTFGYDLTLLRKWVTNQQYVDTTSSGRMRLFDDDGTTVLLTWTLRDRDGNAITTPAGSPAQRGEAT